MPAVVPLSICNALHEAADQIDLWARLADGNCHSVLWREIEDAFRDAARVTDLDELLRRMTLIQKFAIEECNELSPVLDLTAEITRKITAASTG